VVASTDAGWSPVAGPSRRACRWRAYCATRSILRSLCPLEVAVSKVKNRQEYLEEHLRYEIEMLHYTFAKMHREENQSEWNSAFVAFAVHARNLVDFLTNEKNPRNFNASDFTNGYEEPKDIAIRGTMDKLHRDVFHLGKLRPRAVMEKINIERVGHLYGWLAKAIPIFEAKLTAESRRYWKLGMTAVPAVTPVAVSFGPTLPTRTTTTVFHSASMTITQPPRRFKDKC
jgi:hypothetical protein